MVQLCITHLPDTFKRFLKLDAESQKAYKSRKFEEIQKILKLYLSDLIKVCIGNPFFIFVTHTNIYIYNVC